MPEEAVAEHLESKRFVINLSSMEAMSRIKDALPAVQKTFPYFCGLGFFGSRTKGQENEKSDIDIRMFYDSTNESFEKEDEDYGFREIKTELWKAAGISLDRYDWAYDISEKATSRDVESFASHVSWLEKDGLLTIDNLLSNPLTQRLFSRFFLCIGEDVYRNRQYILDKFKGMERGDFYFKMLMESLEGFERPREFKKYQTPEYKRFPKTIAEAEKYFITQSIEQSSDSARIQT